MTQTEIWTSVSAIDRIQALISLHDEGVDDAGPDAYMELECIIDLSPYEQIRQIEVSDDRRGIIVITSHNSYTIMPSGE